MKNSLLTIVALAMLVGLVACEPRPTISLLPTPTSAIPTAALLPSPTSTPTAETNPAPTSTPALTFTPQMTVTPCPIPTPDGSVSQILVSAGEWHSGESYGGSVTSISLVNSDGNGMRQIYEGIGVIGDLQLSPDGTKVAFSDSHYIDIDEQRYSSGRGYVLDLATGQAWPVTPDSTSRHAWGLRWISNELLVYAGRTIEAADSSSNVYLTDVYGEEGYRQLTDRQVGRSSILDIAVSPDGTQLVCAQF